MYETNETNETNETEKTIFDNKIFLFFFNLVVFAACIAVTYGIFLVLFYTGIAALVGAFILWVIHY